MDALKDTQIELIVASKAGEVGETSLLNHQFRDQIGQMAQNPYLIASIKQTPIDHTRLSQTFFAPHMDADHTRIAQAIDQHDAMIFAIESHEPSLAIDLALQHGDLSRDEMEIDGRPAPLPLDAISMKDRRNAV